MDALVLYNVPHDIPFHPVFMTMWFFLLSMSAASFFISFMGLHGVKKFDGYVETGLFAAIGLIGIAPLFIIMQLGQPLRAFQLMLNFNVTSPLSWGVAILLCYAATIVAFAWQLFFRGDRELAKRFGLFAAPFALALFLYSGSVLMVVESRPLWHTSLMPVLFAASGFVSAVAFLLLVDTFGDLLRRIPGAGHVLGMQKADGLTSPLRGALVQDIGLDLILIATLLVALATGSQAARDTVALLLRGEMSGIFLGVQLLLGAALPLGLLLFFKRSRALVAAAAVAAIVGIYAMRYVFIIGGLVLPLS